MVANNRKDPYIIGLKLINTYKCSFEIVVYISQQLFGHCVICPDSKFNFYFDRINWWSMYTMIRQIMVTVPGYPMLTFNRNINK